jgi:hypothetical protein
MAAVLTEDQRAWLLEGDPSIAWQVQRDLLDEPDRTWQRTRRRIASEGWGAALLATRDSEGRWGGGWYSPKWISTFYTVQLLVRLGVDPSHADTRASARLLLGQAVPEAEPLPERGAFSDTCVIGMLLSIAGGLDLLGDPRAARLVDRLMDQRMLGGGWNCELRDDATHPSVHTTLSVMEGLGAWQSLRADPAVAEAIQHGEEFLLAHRLFRSHRTGEVIRADFTRFSFPTWWFYDVLRALEYFAVRAAPWDERLTDAVELLRKRRRDGRWPVQNRHSGREWFRMEPTGHPSRWNTLRALRVERWLAEVMPS